MMIDETTLLDGMRYYCAMIRFSAAVRAVGRRDYLFPCRSNPSPKASAACVVLLLLHKAVELALRSSGGVDGRDTEVGTYGKARQGTVIMEGWQGW